LIHDADYHRRWRAANREKSNAASAAWKKRNPDAARKRNRLVKYGLTQEGFDQLFASQSGLCGICFEPLDETVAVDHCHETDAVRGLLHRGCNAALGQLGDDYLLVQRAALYLHRTRQDSRIHPWAVIGDPPEHRDHRDRPGLQPVIDPSARIEAFVTVDAGITDATAIGARAWLMKHVHVGHDAHIGEGCELAPGTVIGGHAHLENNVRCGIGVLIRPFIRVGAGARLGAGAVVVKDVPAGEVWVGNPARKLR
jgi:acetyltransferase-like isoleucine patch superfamily enzyme